MDYESILLSLNVLRNIIIILIWSNLQQILIFSLMAEFIFGRIYSIHRDLWIVIDLTPLVIRMQLPRTYLIPVLLYGCEIFSNCYFENNRKLNLVYNKVRRYHISHLAYQILSVKFEN